MVIDADKNIPLNNVKNEQHESKLVSGTERRSYPIEYLK